jgi:hypothetical protein
MVGYGLERIRIVRGRATGKRAREKRARRRRTEVRTNWQVRVSEDEAHRQAAGRRHDNAVCQFRARLRRREVLQLLGAFGWGYGVQARIAATLGVHPAPSGDTHSAATRSDPAP